MRNKPDFSAFRKPAEYLAFAASANLLHMAVFFICRLATKNSIVCNAAAYFVSITASFAANRLVVFKAESGSVSTQLMRYLMIKALAFVIDSTVLLLLGDVLHMPVLWAKLISNASTGVGNYIFSERFVFASDDDPAHR